MPSVLDGAAAPTQRTNLAPSSSVFCEVGRFGGRGGHLALSRDNGNSAPMVQLFTRNISEWISVLLKLCSRPQHQNGFHSKILYFLITTIYWFLNTYFGFIRMKINKPPLYWILCVSRARLRCSKTEATGSNQRFTLNLNQWKSLRFSEKSLNSSQYSTSEKIQLCYIDRN